RYWLRRHVRVSIVGRRVVVVRLERYARAGRQGYGVVEAVHPLPVEVPVIDLDEALGLSGGERGLNVHLAAEKMHVWRDDPGVRVEERRDGEASGDFVVRIVRRNGERIVDQRQDAQQLLRPGLRKVDADARGVGLRRVIVRVIVYLEHHAR